MTLTGQCPLRPVSLIRGQENPLGPGLRHPLGHRRKGGNGLHITPGPVRQRGAVGDKTHADRGVERIDQAECAEEEGAAAGLQRALPHAQDLVDVALHGRVPAPPRQIGLDVHHHVLAQGAKAAVHAGAQAASQRPLGHVARPECELRKTLGQVFADGQRVPDAQIAVFEHRHLRHGREGRQLRGKLGRVEPVRAFFEGNAKRGHRHPGAHGPGGIIFVADVQDEHDGPSRGR